MTGGSRPVPVPLAAALAAVREVARPVAPRILPLRAAFGRVAAEAVLAPADEPSTPRAARDGWAVRAEAAAGAGAWSPVTLDAVPVRAGEPLPPHADAVLPPEAVAAGPLGLEALADLAPGEGVLDAGAEVRAGAPLLAPGEPVGPAVLAALAGAGIARLAVRAPGVALLRADGTGPAGDGLALALAALAREAGARLRPAAAPPVGQDLAAALPTAPGEAVFLLAGPGEAAAALARDALARAGRVLAPAAAIEPGGAAAFGVLADGRPALILPGTLADGLAAALALARPLLDALAGRAPRPAPPRLLLARKVTSAIGTTGIVLLGPAGEGVEPLHGPALARLARARGFALIPPEREGYPEGAMIEVHPL